MKKLILALALGLLATSAKAQTPDPRSGNFLLETCRQARPIGETSDWFTGHCVAWIAGVVQGAIYGGGLGVMYLPDYDGEARNERLSKPGIAIGLCMPDGVSHNQLADIVLKYLEDNPEKRHWNSVVLIIDAMTDVYPCSQ